MNKQVKKVTVKEGTEGDITVNIKLAEKVDKIKLAVAKVTTLEDALLRVDTIGPEEVKHMVDEEIYALEVHTPPQSLNPGGARIPNNFRYVTARPIRVVGITRVDEGVLVNSDFLVANDANGTVSKVEDLVLQHKEEAQFLCELLTDIEIENVHQMDQYIQEVKKFLKDQKENNRF